MVLTANPSTVAIDARNPIGIGRRFTSPDVGPYDTIEWAERDARISSADQSIVFEQRDVEFPVQWSATAANIVAQKYFRGQPGSPERERSLRQVVDRIVDTITHWGRADGYFADDDEAEAFNAELKFIMVTQRAAFNSPVWFNIGVPDVPQQASACFILSVDDDMRSILDWYRDEGLIFKGGSGAGANLSRIRSSIEPLGGGGTASGPVSFMRGADASAGAIKSGGTTRRAAKMVILDVGHPDIEEFVEAKTLEEHKIRVLRDAGFDMGLGGSDTPSVQFQNANNSVRVSDEFMRSVVDDAEWGLEAVTTGETIRTVRARELWRKICSAAWDCADPGVQFDSSINRWHTAPAAGRITGSNPCSEYFHLDDSACNLASLNLRRFTDEGGEFDVHDFAHTVEIVFTAQDILVGRADYPTPPIEANTKAYRQIGLGYANLGGLLMALGHPYDSDAGRAWAAAITSLMTGAAYSTSARIATRLGPFEGFTANAEPMLNVLHMHRDAARSIDDAGAAPPGLIDAAQRVWDEVIECAEKSGVRNSQATVLAPTGTIGLTMDCDTTGIEPDFALVKTKTLFGGGSIVSVNKMIPIALRTLGYTTEQTADIETYIDLHHSVRGAPHLSAEHAVVFACSGGDDPIHYEGHLRMMAAVQPLLSGGISKTVNLPETATVDDVEGVYRLGWELGLKAVAIYRDNCKVGQPLSARTGSGPRVESTTDAGAIAEQVVGQVIDQNVGATARPVRRRLSRSRPSRTFEFRVGDCKGYTTIGEYDDGQPGEIFLTVSKQGSTMAGVMDAFAKSISYGLQYGVPIRAFVEAFTNMRFEPAGITDDPDIRFAASIMDYLFRRLAIDYLTYDERSELGIFTVGERLQPTLPGIDEATIAGAGAVATSTIDAPMCMLCGVSMVRAGSCHVCTRCGNTSGCS
jgi:ribonucleoside-diphosphate reductase alpha chain